MILRRKVNLHRADYPINKRVSNQMNITYTLSYPDYTFTQYNITYNIRTYCFESLQWNLCWGILIKEDYLCLMGAIRGIPIH